MIKTFELFLTFPHTPLSTQQILLALSWQSTICRIWAFLSPLVQVPPVFPSWSLCCHHHPTAFLHTAARMNLLKPNWAHVTPWLRTCKELPVSLRVVPAIRPKAHSPYTTWPSAGSPISHLPPFPSTLMPESLHLPFPLPVMSFPRWCSHPPPHHSAHVSAFPSFISDFLTINIRVTIYLLTPLYFFHGTEGT